jgi:hypothetical protein
MKERQSDRDKQEGRGGGKERNSIFKNLDNAGKNLSCEFQKQDPESFTRQDCTPTIANWKSKNSLLNTYSIPVTASCSCMYYLIQPDDSMKLSSFLSHFTILKTETWRNCGTSLE